MLLSCSPRQDINVRFFAFRHKAAAIFVARGETRNSANTNLGRVNWDEIRQTVDTFTRTEVIMARAPNRIVLLSDYIQTDGHPDTNGKGHAIITHQGYQCVRIPGQRWGIRARLDATQVAEQWIV